MEAKAREEAEKKEVEAAREKVRERERAKEREERERRIAEKLDAAEKAAYEAEQVPYIHKCAVSTVNGTVLQSRLLQFNVL